MEIPLIDHQRRFIEQSARYFRLPVDKVGTAGSLQLIYPSLDVAGVNAAQCACVQEVRA